MSEARLSTTGSCGGAGRWHGLPALQHISGGASRDGAGSQAADPGPSQQHEWESGESTGLTFLQLHKVGVAGMSMQMPHTQDEWTLQRSLQIVILLPNEWLAYH